MTTRKTRYLQAAALLSVGLMAVGCALTKQWHLAAVNLGTMAMIASWDF